MEEKNLTGYSSIDKPWLKYYTEEQINAPLPHMTAYKYLKYMNQDRLDYCAIDSAEGNYTYGDLFTAIDKTAAALYQMGAKKGTIVLAMLPVLPHESFLFYGVDAVGAALAQIPPQSLTKDVCSFANKYGVKLFFVSESLLTPEMEQAIYTQTTVEHIISIGSMLKELQDARTLSWDIFIGLGKDKKIPEVNRNSKDLLFLANTGGSTGEPKSVMLNDDCFNIIVHQFINSDVPYDTGDRWIRLWPLFSAAAAVANSHLPLCMGMNVLHREFPQNIKCFDKMILEDKPNHLILIPQLIDVLEQSELLKNADLSFVKTAGCGGLGMTAQFEERINRFYKSHKISTFLGHGWGCTENASNIAMRSNFRTTKIGTVGAPMVNTVVSVFDPETDAELKYGEEGELCVQSHTIMMGYYKDSKMTAKAIRTHTDGTVWLHTGDLGSISEDGIVTVKGRMTRVIFVFPTAKIYPQAMETAVSKVDGVQEVAFCQIPDQEHNGFFQPVCFVVPNQEYTSDEVKKAVIDYCNESFPEYSRPCAIYICEELPLTRVGKVDISALEKFAMMQTEQQNT